MKLTFFGAAHAVTGSCHCLEVNGTRALWRFRGRRCTLKSCLWTGGT